jgi:hypothetical protein
MNNTPGSSSQEGIATTGSSSIRKLSLDLNKKEMLPKSHKLRKSKNKYIDIFSMNYVPKKLDFSKNDPETDSLRKRKWSFGYEKEIPPLKLKDVSKFLKKENLNDSLHKKLKIDEDVGLENNGSFLLMKSLKEWDVDINDAKMQNLSLIKVKSWKIKLRFYKKLNNF